MIRKSFLFIFVSFCFFLWIPKLFAGNFSYTELKQVIPNEFLPKEVKALNANNNLDAICYQDEYYLAFRTAPSHFASKKAKIYIIKSPDNINWHFEDSIVLHTDLRECRFFELNGKLFMCFFKAGTKWYKFEPKELYMGERIGEQNWEWKGIGGLDGYVPWRVRVLNDTAYLSAYYGKGLYQNSHAGDLRLFLSTNGYNWAPISEETQVNLPNAEEGAFIFDKNGELWANIRMESSGSAIAHASKGNYANWNLFPSKYKYDSAILFECMDEIYMIARRNMDGLFDRAPGFLPQNWRRLINLARFSLTKKVTALFKLNKSLMEWEAILDFPSTGDNAFPALIQLSDTEWYLYNYSSDITGNAKNWISGQIGKTFIYSTKLTFHP